MKRYTKETEARLLAELDCVFGNEKVQTYDSVTPIDTKGIRESLLKLKARIDYLLDTL
jgi:hypothetical protein